MMPILNVSISPEEENGSTLIAREPLAKTPPEGYCEFGTYRAKVDAYTMPSGRVIRIVAEGDSLEGMFSIVVAEGLKVLAQTAGRASPYLHLWVNIDGQELFIHLE